MHRLILLLTIFVLLTVNLSFAQSEELLVLPEEEAADDRFGLRISVSGDDAIVGAFRHDLRGSDAGAAYIMQRSGNQWIQITKLSPSALNADDAFGVSVSISGDYAIVGAFGDDDINSGSGAAYVFERNNNFWSEEPVQKLKASGNGSNGVDDGFGQRVAISGDYAIVGAFRNDFRGTDAGEAYMFERQTNGNWEQTTVLGNSEISQGDEFGIEVSIDGDYAIVGAPGDGNQGDGSGAAYIYERSQTGEWELIEKLTASNGGFMHRFGANVAISGDYAIVGAALFDEQGNEGDTGAAYIFERVIEFRQPRWREKAVLRGNAQNASDQFGSSVAISGDYALVGMQFDEGLNGDLDVGSAYLFQRLSTASPDSFEWKQIENIRPSDGGISDYFGSSVALNQEHALVGAPAADNNGALDAGKVYAFQPNLPELISAPVTTVEANTIYSYRVEAEGFPKSTFNLIAAPPGMTIDTETGVVTWIPDSIGSFSYTVEALNSQGRDDPQDYAINVIIPDGVAIQTDPALPETYQLHQNHPNPFNPSTVISFDIASPGNIKLSVYDMLGREIRLLEEGFFSTGSYKVNFQADELTSGTYLYRLETPQGTYVRKMLYIK